MTGDWAKKLIETARKDIPFDYESAAKEIVKNMKEATREDTIKDLMPPEMRITTNLESVCIKITEVGLDARSTVDETEKGKPTHVAIYKLIRVEKLS